MKKTKEKKRRWYPTKAQKAKLKQNASLAGKANKAKIDKMSELGLVQPAKIAQDSPEFAELQAKWYAKLQDTGFKDLEWTDANSSKGQNSGYLRGTGAIKSKEHAEARELYYSMCSNWLVHAGPSVKIDRRIFELHAAGISIRAISEKIYIKNTKTIYDKLVIMRQECQHWNKTNALGILKSRELESEMVDKWLARAWEQGRRLFSV